MKKLFSHKYNHFSFEHSYLAEVNGQIAGVINGFTGKEKSKEELRTTILMVRYLTFPVLKNIFAVLKLKYFKKIIQLIGLLKIWGKLDSADYYINGLAVFPEFQGVGIGTMLLEYIDRNRKISGQTKLFLDVEIDNKKAINVYERFGFIRTEKTISLDFDGKKLGFFRMVKD